VAFARPGAGPGRPVAIFCASWPVLPADFICQSYPDFSRGELTVTIWYPHALRAVRIGLIIVAALAGASCSTVAADYRERLPGADSLEAAVSHTAAVPVRRTLNSRGAGGGGSVWL
jgi:hypothetical protein